MGGVFCYKDETVGEFVFNRQEFQRTQGRGQSQKRKGLGGLQSGMGEDSFLESLVFDEVLSVMGK